MSYRIVDKKQKQHMEPGPTRRKLRITRPAQRKAQISQQQLTSAFKKAERSALQAARKVPKFRRKYIRREYDQQVPINTSRVAVGRSQAKIFTKGNVQVVSHSEYTHTFQLTTGANGVDFYIFPETSTYGPTDVNPGFPAFLPWASSIAKDYERYKFNKLNFRFIPKQPTTASGMLMLMYDYDFCDEAPTTKVEFLQNATSLEASTFTPIVLSVNPKLLAEGTLTGGWRYVSNGSSSSSTESRETMAGFLVAAADGLAPTTTYSWDMWVEYELLLKVPRPPVESDESVQLETDAGYPFTVQPNAGGGMVLTNLTHNNFTVTPVSGLGSVLNNNSAPASAGVDSSRSTLLFRLLRQVAGLVKIDLSWNAVDCTGGTHGPSDKGGVNQWTLNGRDSAGNLITTAYRAVIPTRSESSSTYALGRFKRSDTHNPSVDDTSLGMTLDFAIGPKVFQAISAAGKKITDIWWELVSSPAVTLLTSVATTSVVISFSPTFRGNHRIVLAEPLSLPSIPEDEDSDEEEVAPQVTLPIKKKK